tara:strand:+ start:408 stop:719 length:312 start_codon:yes stop_codon:yes gene_type:complete
MEKSNFKVKYIIGSYKDSEDYPTKEDLFAMADKWYHLDGGKNFIHDYRGLEDGGETIFTLDLLEHSKLPKQKGKNLISNLLESGDLSVFKETKHTTYHIITKR